MVENLSNYGSIVLIYGLAAALLLSVVYIVRLQRRLKKTRKTSKSVVSDIINKSDTAVKVMSAVMVEKDKLTAKLYPRKELPHQPDQQDDCNG